MTEQTDALHRRPVSLAQAVGLSAALAEPHRPFVYFEPADDTGQSGQFCFPAALTPEIEAAISLETE